MAKDAVVQIRMDAELKQSVEELYRDMGTSFAESVRIFAKQSLASQGMPFQISLVGDKERHQAPPKTIDDIARLVSIVCEKYPVARAYLFGSYARGGQTAKSDIDIRLEIDRSLGPFGFFAYDSLLKDLQDVLGVNVDIITKDIGQLQSSSPQLFHSLEKDEVLIYERKE